MADDLARRAQLEADFLAQTARIPFTELQRYFAGGRVVSVGADLDLVQVATELAMDNAQLFADWIAAGRITPVPDDLAAEWLAEGKQLWAVVANPWVLVQDGPQTQFPTP